MSPSASPITAKVGAVSEAVPDRPPLAWADNVLLFGLFLLLAFAVVAFGAVEPWSIFIFESGALVLFVIWAIKHMVPAQFALEWNPLYPAFAIVAGVVAIQLALGLTVYRAATMEQGLKYLAYVFLIVVANDVFRRPHSVQRFALLLSFFGLALACVSLAQNASHSSKLLFVLMVPDTGWSFGPYVNHSHYAALMLMLAAFPLPLAMAPYLRGRMRVLLGAAAAVMVSTIFLAGSRAGIIAFFAQAAFLALVFARGRQHRRKVAITMCIGFVVVAGLFAVSKGLTFEQVTRASVPVKIEVPGLRLDVLRDSRAMLGERPILGWGLGTFEHVYPQFRSAYTNNVTQHAHNDYLELLLETGTVGFIGVLWFVVVLLGSGWKSLPQWKSGSIGIVKIGAMAGCVAMLVHSLMDFSLQIPANAALFYVLSTMVAGKTEGAETA